MKPIRYYNALGQLVGYADANYAFTCQRDADGNMINYQNTKGQGEREPETV